MNSTEQALGARTILFTQRNLQPSLEWLRAIGLDPPSFPARCFARKADDVSYEIATSEDIIEEVASGQAFGLVGSDKFYEQSPNTGLEFEPIGKLACRFALFVPKSVIWDRSKAITVATSNPRALMEFIEQEDLKVADIVVKKGKVERLPASGQTDAGFDLVETGQSLRSNGLSVVLSGSPVALGGIYKEE